MKLRINGKEHLCQGEIKLEDFVVDKNLKADRIVIEYNNQIIAQHRWESIILKEGDTLEIVSFVGGG